MNEAEVDAEHEQNRLRVENAKLRRLVAETTMVLAQLRAGQPARVAERARVVPPAYAERGASVASATGGDVQSAAGAPPATVERLAEIAAHARAARELRSASPGSEPVSVREPGHSRLDLIEARLQSVEAELWWVWSDRVPRESEPPSIVGGPDAAVYANGDGPSSAGVVRLQRFRP